jgi:hypothetical protein
MDILFKDDVTVVLLLVISFMRNMHGYDKIPNFKSRKVHTKKAIERKMQEICVAIFVTV